MTAYELRERGQRLLADCLQKSACDPDASDAIGYLIGEMASVSEGVLSLMPVDSQALTDGLAEAHRVLVALIEDVERVGRQAGRAERRAARAGRVGGCRHGARLEGAARRRGA